MVAEFQPEDNCVATAGGRRIAYDFLVVAPGIQIEWPSGRKRCDSLCKRLGDLE